MDDAVTGDVGKIVEYAPNLIYVNDQVQHKNAYINRCIGEKLGYSPDVIQRMGADLMPSLIHPDDLPRVFEHFSNIRSLSDGDSAALEYRIKHCQGHWVWLLSHDTVYRRDSSGKVTHHIGAATDISAQKQSEADALAARAKEAVTNQELREFAYAISHDLKAPSNTMRLILTELEEELSCTKDSAAAQLLGLANITVGRMIRLVEDVLHFTSIVGQETKFEKVDLGSVLEEVLLLSKADIQDAKVTVD
ncbi:MAG: PAS domain-containing protein, partial [Paracoccaceae bacterium]